MRLAAALIVLAALLPEPARSAGAVAACLELTGPQAKAVCQDAHALEPNNLDVAFKLAWTMVGHHEPAEGIAFLEEIAAAHPGDWRTHYNLAGAMSAVAAYHLAGGPVERAMALSDEPRIRHMAAEIYQNNGQPELAHAMHLQLAGLGWKNAMFELAEDYALGRGTGYDQQSARLWYRRAAEAGHVLSMRILAAKLEVGAFGGARDPEGAAYWRAQAARATEGLPGG